VGYITLEMKKHFNITISGRVQGVGFRYAARNVAKSLGIKGFAKNLFNGNVYIEAEGDEELLAEFLSWCNRGPEHADVMKVDAVPGETVFFDCFDIRH
jgi:acylphosphatase